MNWRSLTNKQRWLRLLGLSRPEQIQAQTLFEAGRLPDGELDLGRIYSDAEKQELLSREQAKISDLNARISQRRSELSALLSKNSELAAAIATKKQADLNARIDQRRVELSALLSKNSDLVAALATKKLALERIFAASPMEKIRQMQSEISSVRSDIQKTQQLQQMLDPLLHIFGLPADVEPQIATDLAAAADIAPVDQQPESTRSIITRPYKLPSIAPSTE
jgi:hypothetical protein